MLLYHGTTEASARNALRVGLKPRALTKKNNWKHSIASRLDSVYLTRLYAVYFAYQAVENDERIGILEIDTNKLDAAKFLPDEDYLEQVTRLLANDEERDMPRATRKFRRDLPKYAPLWRSSVEELGTCCYRGIIEPDAIMRCAIWDYHANLPLWLACVDAKITLLNAKIMREHYEALTKWVIGRELSKEDWQQALLGDLAKYFPERVTNEQRAYAEQVFENRKGWELIKGVEHAKRIHSHKTERDATTGRREGISHE